MCSHTKSFLRYSMWGNFRFRDNEQNSQMLHTAKRQSRWQLTLRWDNLISECQPYHRFRCFPIIGEQQYPEFWREERVKMPFLGNLINIYIYIAKFYSGFSCSPLGKFIMWRCRNKRVFLFDFQTWHFNLNGLLFIFLLNAFWNQSHQTLTKLYVVLMFQCIII